MKTFIRIISDLHIEFQPLHLLGLPTDKDGVLVVAGDVCPYKNTDMFVDFFQQVSPMFKEVVFVAGNHEFYQGGHLPGGYNTMKRLLSDHHLYNVHLLDDECVVFDGVAFIGSTLWTDFQNFNPVKMVTAKSYMMDYSETLFVEQFSSSRRLLRPEDVAELHKKSRKYIFDTVAEQKALGNKVVVVVHHGVSEQSVHARFKGNHANCAFISNLDDEILATQPDLVVHGHVHNCFDYKIGETRVVVNPRAYPRENAEWDEFLVVQL